MTQKFYFHDATTADTGTLPGASSQSGTSPSVTASGASTNRSMDDTIGASQVAPTLATLAQTASQKNWFRRYCSPPLAAQSVSGSTWQTAGAVSQSNTNSNLLLGNYCIYFWRPGTGAMVVNDSAGNFVIDVNTNPTIVTTSTTSETAGGPTNITGIGATYTGANALLGGDILVCEVWTRNTQGKSTSYTNTLFYDGTTEGSTTSNAAYLLAPADLALYVATSPPHPLPRYGQSVMRAATR